MSGNGQDRPVGLSPQQAIKIMRLRVPPAGPANAPINPTLLNAPGGAGAGGNIASAVLQQLMRIFQPPLSPGGGVSLPGGPVSEDDGGGSPPVSRPGVPGGHPVPIGPSIPAEPIPQPPAPRPPRVRPGTGGDDEGQLPEPPALPPYYPDPGGIDIQLPGWLGAKRNYGPPGF